MQKIKEYIKNFKLIGIKIFYKIINVADIIYQACVLKSLYHIFCLLPLQNKIVTSTFNGKKYGDNSKYIIEKLHEMDKNIDIVWLKDNRYSYIVPEYVRTVSYRRRLANLYEYATAKVWLDTHRIFPYLKKRNKQLFIETWHGGLGIKKLDMDVPKFRESYNLRKEVKTMIKNADVFISNSDHLTNIYRSAFKYNGFVWKIGYPKNDFLFENPSGIRKKIRENYQLLDDTRIMLYAPTFRDLVLGQDFDMSVYAVDFNRLHSAVSKYFGGEWKIFIRLHPFFTKMDIGQLYEDCSDVINATQYPDMQELILACDAFISDYSSCIFDAALRDIPCFTFATDFEEYKGDRGVYYEMEELPFPYARNNDALMKNIESFDYDAYIRKWEAFKERTGLYETGHAARDIAYVINEFIKGNNEPLKTVKREECEK